MGILKFFKNTIEFSDVQNALEAQSIALMNENKKCDLLKGLSRKEKEGQAAATTAGQLISTFFMWYCRANSKNQHAFLRHQNSVYYGNLLTAQYLKAAGTSLEMIGKDRAKAGIKFWTSLPLSFILDEYCREGVTALDLLSSTDTVLLSVRAICDEVGDGFRYVFWDHFKELLVHSCATHEKSLVRHNASTLFSITEESILQV